MFHIIYMPRIVIVVIWFVHIQHYFICISIQYAVIQYKYGHIQYICIWDGFVGACASSSFTSAHTLWTAPNPARQVRSSESRWSCRWTPVETWERCIESVKLSSSRTPGLRSGSQPSCSTQSEEYQTGEVRIWCVGVLLDKARWLTRRVVSLFAWQLPGESGHVSAEQRPEHFTQCLNSWSTDNI